MSAPRGFGRKVAHPPDLVFLFALFLRRVPHPFAICAKGWAARADELGQCWLTFREVAGARSLTASARQLVRQRISGGRRANRRGYFALAVGGLALCPDLHDRLGRRICS